MVIKILIISTLIGLILSGCVTTEVTLENIKKYNNSFNLTYWNTPPVVSGYKSKELVEYFNTILPPSFKLIHGTSEEQSGENNFVYGEIRIIKLKKHQEKKRGNCYVNENSEACSIIQFDKKTKRIDSSIITIPKYAKNCMDRLQLLKHEMMHSLGFTGGHVHFQDSVLYPHCRSGGDLSDLDKTALFNHYNKSKAGRYH